LVNYPHFCSTSCTVKFFGKDKNILPKRTDQLKEEKLKLKIKNHNILVPVKIHRYQQPSKFIVHIHRTQDLFVFNF